MDTLPRSTVDSFNQHWPRLAAPAPWLCPPSWGLAWGRMGGAS